MIVQLEQREKSVIQVGDRELILDPSFRKYWNAIQVAEIVAGHEDSDTLPGDKVYVHHFVQNPEHILPVEGTYSWLERNQVFCRVRDGKIKALLNYVFVEPIMYKDVKSFSKTDSGILLTRKPGTDYIERIGIARHLCDSAKEAGLKEGDKIIFGKNCEYDLEVEGKIYFRMELRDVVCTIDDHSRLTRVV
jgi:co-chaperonin GroES (HSP10)